MTNRITKSTKYLLLAAASVALGAAGAGRAESARKDKAVKYGQAVDELERIAKARGVSFDPDLVSYFRQDGDAVAHAPVAGYEKYSDEDFRKGVPLMVITIDVDGGSRLLSDVPAGSYLVVATIEPKATDGKVTFINARGREVASRPLTRRDVADFTELFPDSDDPPTPVNIPNITSTHVWVNGHIGVDCTGWKPPRTIYYTL